MTSEPETSPATCGWQDRFTLALAPGCTTRPNGAARLVSGPKAKTAGPPPAGCTSVTLLTSSSSAPVSFSVTCWTTVAPTGTLPKTTGLGVTSGVESSDVIG